MPIVIAPLLVGFAVLAAALVLLSLHHSLAAWLRPLLDELAHPKGNWLRRAAFGPVSLIARAVLKIEHRVASALSHAAAHMMTPLAKWISGLIHHVLMVPRELEHLGDTIADAFARLVTHTIPRAIHRVTNPIDARARAALKAATRSISLVHSLDKRLTRGIDRLRDLVTHQVLTRLHGIDRLIRDTILPRIRTAEREVAGVITRDIPNLKLRIGRIEKALGLGIIAATVLRTLARVAPWLFCRNVKKVGNTLCGMNPQALDALLAALIAGIAIRDLRTLARFAEGVEREMAEEVRRLVS